VRSRHSRVAPPPPAPLLVSSETRSGNMRFAPRPLTSCFGAVECACMYEYEQERCDEVIGVRARFDPFDWLGRDYTSSDTVDTATLASSTFTNRSPLLAPPQHTPPIIFPVLDVTPVESPPKYEVPQRRAVLSPAVGRTNQGPRGLRSRSAQVPNRRHPQDPKSAPSTSEPPAQQPEPNPPPGLLQLLR